MTSLPWLCTMVYYYPEVMCIIVNLSSHHPSPMKGRLFCWLQEPYKKITKAWFRAPHPWSPSFLSVNLLSLPTCPFRVHPIIRLSCFSILFLSVLSGWQKVSLSSFVHPTCVAYAVITFCTFSPQFFPHTHQSPFSTLFPQHNLSSLQTDWFEHSFAPLPQLHWYLYISVW